MIQASGIFSVVLAFGLADGVSFTCGVLYATITMQTAMGGSRDPSAMMTVEVTGPVWIAKGAPGTSDYINFFKAAADSGLRASR